MNAVAELIVRLHLGYNTAGVNIDGFTIGADRFGIVIGVKPRLQHENGCDALSRDSIRTG